MLTLDGMMTAFNGTSNLSCVLSNRQNKSKYKCSTGDFVFYKPRGLYAEFTKQVLCVISRIIFMQHCKIR